MQERVLDWKNKLGSVLGLQIIEISGDSEVTDAAALDAADVICTTPEKFGNVVLSSHLLYVCSKRNPLNSYSHPVFPSASIHS